MLDRVLVVPAAPVLVPQVAQGAAPELAGVRTAVLEALADALQPGVGDGESDGPMERVVVVGPGASTRRHGPGARGSFRPIGVDLELAWGVADVESDPLPLSLTIGAWMLAQLPWAGHTVGLEVAEAASPAVCEDLGSDLAAESGRTALLVMADGTARRGHRAPGYTDPRSAGYDEAWIGAVASADTGALAGLDPRLAQDLMMAGRAPLQVLAAAVSAAGGRWRASLRWTGDPYGVAYAVATWQRLHD